MDQAKVGDVVRTASGFEPILGWFHASRNAKNIDFLEISHEHGVSNHFLLKISFTIPF